MGKGMNPWMDLFQVLIVFSGTWLMTQGRGQTTTQDPSIHCNDTSQMNECLVNLPQITDKEIPSNPQALENACKVFNSGMACVDKWSSACLTKQEKEKALNSVSGALETYQLLCNSKDFQRQYLKHTDCYKKISHYWDECARKFIESLKRVDHARDVLSLCCIRYRYIHCVTDVAHTLCNKEAARFLTQMAESLARSKIRNYHPSQCSQIREQNCSAASSAPSSSTKFTWKYPLSLLHLILAYPAKGLVNSLNVLQNLAFTDISTFLCALERELSPYFSHHLQKTDEDDDTDLKDIQSKIATSTSSYSSADVTSSPTVGVTPFSSLCSRDAFDKRPVKVTNNVVAQETTQ